MKKDVIYIDIEDDITSIIDKVNQASSNIVALVPPKRVGVLQSAVNLKLLLKAADTNGKRIVLITSDAGLSALAAGVRIPVAKNLQSKPEIAAVTPQDEADESDIINGDELPVGELARSSAPAAAGTSLGLDAAAEEASKSMDDQQTSKKFSAAAAAGSLKKSGMKIPNFDSFRKKLFLIGGASVALIIFLIWAFAFAPRATVTVTAKTNPIDIQKDLILDPGAEPDIGLGRMKPDIKQVKKTAATEFAATGTREIGERATASVKVVNCDSSSAFTIPAGTIFKAKNELSYASTAAVMVPGFSGSASACRNLGSGAGTASIGISAPTFGPQYNSGPTDFAIEGIDGDIYASTESIGGGTQETVKVISQADVDKAIDQLDKQDDKAAKSELKKQFTADAVLIEESYKAEASQPRPEPAVGEKTDRGRLTVETTYTLVGLAREDVKKVLNDVLNDDIKEDSTQRIYSSGDKMVRFSNFQSGENNVSSVRLNTTGYIGPNINEKVLTSQLVGKRYGEIEQIVNRIEGVEEVDIDFSPFWVGKAPSEDKITVRFSVKTDAE